MMKSTASGLEGTLQLRISLEVDHQILHARLVVRRHEPDMLRVAGQVDRAPFEAKGVPQLSGDRLEVVDVVER